MGTLSPSSCTVDFDSHREIDRPVRVVIVGPPESVRRVVFFDDSSQNAGIKMYGVDNLFSPHSPPHDDSQRPSLPLLDVDPRRVW